jgi:uncharacterized protein with beta-barrel porin domain
LRTNRRTPAQYFLPGKAGWPNTRLQRRRRTGAANGGGAKTDLTGGGFGLTYNAMSATDTRSELGARLDTLQVVDNMPLVWHGRVAWAHDWVSNPALGAAFQSLPGASFTVNGAAPPPNSALASAGAKLYITPALSLDAKFDGEFADGSQTYSGTGTLRYAW